jgi:hypothetical protein
MCSHKDVCIKEALWSHSCCLQLMGHGFTSVVMSMPKYKNLGSKESPHAIEQMPGNA